MAIAEIAHASARRAEFTTKGLRVERRFTREGVHPYSEIEWDLRESVIPGAGGNVFEQSGVEVPKFWSQTATNVVASKYFRGKLGSPEREWSVKQMVDRVVDTIARAGFDGGYFASEADRDAFADELKYLMVHQHASFNSPVWFNIGVPGVPQQASACQPYRARVSTPFGLIPIGQIVERNAVGLPVYDSAGLTVVVATKHNGRKSVYRVQLANGTFVEATGDHLVSVTPTSRAKTATWVRIDELKKGMRLRLRTRAAAVLAAEGRHVVEAVAAIVKGAALVAAGPRDDTRYEDFVARLPDGDVDVSEAALAGWAQGDGFVGQYAEGTNRSLTVEFEVANAEEREWVLRHLDVVFPNVHRHESLHPTLPDYRKIRLYGEVLRKFVEKYDLLARRDKIRVPEPIWSAGPAVVTAYLRSVFQTDGYVTTRRERVIDAVRGTTVIGQRGSAEVATTSRRWMEEVHLLLLSRGVYSRVFKKLEKREDREDTWVVSISYLSERTRFAENVGFIASEKHNELIESLSFRGKRSADERAEAIVDINELGEEDVYDIQTLSGEYLSNNVVVHNCFILSVEDDMHSILDWFRNEGVIFKGGSGSGLNVSKIRSQKENLSGGGFASGPVSFMRGADSVAGSIKSGGTTRRAAKMVILDSDHPDLREFIWCKAKEEKKAWALGEMGYDMSLNGEAWRSIQFQNANNSVRVSQEFMEKAQSDGDWDLTARVGGAVIETVKARTLLREIAEAAWECGDPGMQFDTTINDWHTCPVSGRINGSNPCFPGDVRVHTTAGLLPIAELFERSQAGEAIRVYTHQATAEVPGSGVLASQPIAVMRNGTSPIVRLRFANGAELRCTPNHRIWTTNRGWVEAASLNDKDQILLNDSVTAPTQATWALPRMIAALAKSFSRGGPVAYRELPDRWSEGLAELTGHLIGDGDLTALRAEWIYGDDDLTNGLLESHEGLLREAFGGASRANMPNGTVQLRVGSAAVRELFQSLGVGSARAQHKRVPAAVFTAPIEVQAGFLRGLYGADGCLSRVENGKANRYVGLGSHSELLLRDVQKLLSTFGIRGRIYRTGDGQVGVFSYIRRDGETVSDDFVPGFDLRVTGRDVELFAEWIGFSSPRKQRQLEALLAEVTRYNTKPTTGLLDRVFDGQAVVYNLTEPRNHSYIVEGFVVANCSEYMHIDDSACNLASLNLMRFLHSDGEFDVERFRAAVEVVFTAQDILVGHSDYPTARIAENARSHRQLGLGYANLGALLMQRGLPYDSNEGRAYAAAVTALMTGAAYAQSARLAGAVGPYEAYPKNRDAHDRVMQMHRLHANRIRDELLPASLLSAARQAWDDAVALGKDAGYRNAQASVLAPTGTISFMMDCDTTGVEPDIALVKYKKLVGGGMLKLVNGTVPAALRRLGYSETEAGTITTYVEQHGTIEGAPALHDDHLAVFDCAFKAATGERSIHHMGHIKMMGAVQPFISGAISKTVNLPETATVDDVTEAYIEAWNHGLKAIAIYRDGSKKVQPVNTSDKDANTKTETVVERIVEVTRPARRRLADTRASLTHKFSIEGHEGYITVGLFEDGTPGELFVTMAKEGSTLSGMMDAFATSVSLLFQYGVPLSHLVEKFGHMRFEPSGWTGNSEIGFAKSIVDYVFRWLGNRFLSEHDRAELGLVRTTEVADVKPQLELLNRVVELAAPDEGAPNGDGHASVPAAQAPAYRRLNSTPDAPPCPRCGWLTVRNGTCHKCENCGETTGCS
jgi:ribonucleotide reductase alpha subunit